ncbi:MAG: L-glutamate gamma-semialdehyde dehydrogenase [Armatimonadota bacterium]|nr:L-glutamate gamma-semialdehyde dehydrogenase [Armatimonadota bacterium]
MIDESRLESKIQIIGRQILADAVRGGGMSVARQWNNRVLEWTMRDAELKVQIFRFVDVLPALKTDEEIVRHLHEYFDPLKDRLPRPMRLGLAAAGLNPLATAAAASFVRRAGARMAKRFIAGSTAAETAKIARRLWERHIAHTVDILGEVAVSEEEAEGYQRKYLELLDELARSSQSWRPNPLLESAGGERIPRANVSVKLSALYSQIEPSAPEKTAEAIKERLRPILRRARELGVFINFDMEYYALKDLTLRVFYEILMEPEFRDWPDVGIAIQGYLRDSLSDTIELVDWVKRRGAPVTVRLVRGAYWDYEVVNAKQRRWSIPVFTRKWQTDQSYEAIIRLLMENYPHIYTAAGSHNVRSIAYAIALAEELDLPDDAFEIQMLYGMGDELKPAVVNTRRRLRVYTPYGELIPGMAYLVRRLLENTANESFLRHGFFEKATAEELLRRPSELAAADHRPEAKVEEPPRPGPFLNEPTRDYSKEENRRLMREALAKVKSEFGNLYPLVIGGKEIVTSSELTSINPANPDEVIGRVPVPGLEEINKAVEVAEAAFPAWGNTKPEERAELLFKVADELRKRRDEIVALEVYEVAKGWAESDADVTEAIDYMEYYAREMIRLGKPRILGDAPGEVNEYFYQPRGVAVVIAPWNFPLAILAGMSSAALVAGNTVIMKPAVQSPIIGMKLIEVYRAAGIPDGVVNFLPGGAEVGEPLVRHPRVNLIAFTGSKAVGIRINQLAAEIAEGQPGMKRVIAEMGGKNAIIIDNDAELDEAALGTIASSFGYQGQKCSASSRIIVLEKAYDEFVGRFVAAARSLRIGPPEDPANFVGPLVDEAALKKVRSYIELGRKEAKLILETDVSGLGNGYYVGPTIFADVDPKARIAQEEIFGPVVVIMRARTIDEALDIAVGTDFALTGGLFSRGPAAIERVKRDFRTGNLYINRKITGAIVGRQPFGGLRFSGIGSKAGGPDYLLQFMEPRVVTENTMRRGFAPDTV